MPRVRKIKSKASRRQIRLEKEFKAVLSNDIGYKT
jgi:hypothetical protein